MKYFVYKYSPKTIGVEPHQNLTVIVPKTKLQEYISLGFSMKNIIVCEPYTIANIFSSLTKQNYSSVEHVFTLDESMIFDIEVLNNFFTNDLHNLMINLLFRDKLFMRLRVHTLGIKQPKFMGDLVSPIITKPRLGQASQGIKIVQEIECNDSLISEEKINYDQMFTCDGIVCNGKIVKFYSNKYDYSPLDSINNGYIVISTNPFYWEDFTKIEELFCLTQEIVDGFDNSKNSIYPFHFEWFYESKEENFIFCEAAKRFGGGRIPEIIDFAFGEKFTNIFWSLINGLPVTVESLTRPKKHGTSFIKLNDGEPVTKFDHSYFNFENKIKYGIAIGKSATTSKDISDFKFSSVFVSSSESEKMKRVQQLKRYCKIE